MAAVPVVGEPQVILVGLVALLFTTVVAQLPVLFQLAVVAVAVTAAVLAEQVL